MGAVKIDLESKEKKLFNQFPIDTEEGVSCLLEQIHHVRSRRFQRGDYAASILLLDFYDAVQDAKLTDRQRQCIYHLYEKDLTQREVADYFGISQQAVSELVANAVRRIASTFKHKEELSA